MRLLRAAAYEPGNAAVDDDGVVVSSPPLLVMVYRGRVRVALMLPLPPPSTVIWKWLCSPFRASNEALE